jgi:hypothetical protein
MKDIESLDTRMQACVRKYIWKCAQAGITVIVLETKRLLSTQMAYYARGRAPVQLVKEYYKRCGLWAISDAEAAVQNTKTLYSKHIDGLAVDIAPAKDGKAWWDAPRELWLKMFAIAENECGLDACADGKWQAWQWDWPHHEFKHEI